MVPESHPDTRLFRLAVLAILILIFITVATTKLWELRIAAERVGVMHTLGSLQSALGNRLSEIVVKEGATALLRLQHSNPIDLLRQPPSDAPPYGLTSGVVPTNYLGEFTSAEAPKGDGVWYFDLEQRMLIYRVRFIDHFYSDNTEYPNLARYQLHFSYRDHNGNGQIDPGQDSITGISIEPVDHYRWSGEAQ